MDDALPAELADARQLLGEGAEAEKLAFAARQRAALSRLGALEAFYSRHSCRLSRLHLMASSVVVLCRFQGHSPALARVGELIHPVDAHGRPRNRRWEAYVAACEQGRAIEVRDELWIAAHVPDIQEVRRERLEELFLQEAAQHPDHPTWVLMKRHFEFTLAVRQLDGPALAGTIALETAMGDALGRSIGRILRDGSTTFGATFLYGLRALAMGQPVYPGLLSYRQVALRVLRHVVTALAVVSVWRKGLKEAARGESSDEAQWPILAQTLGDRVSEVHPLVTAFYNNPAHYDVRCTLELYTRPARFWSWVLTSIAGQGLYEAGPRTHEARIRTYRRTDGSMHFVREIDTGQALRVFDSDFVVRTHRGVPTLFERFPEANLEYELGVTPLGPGLGVSIRGRRLYWRGVQIPAFGLEVEFRSAVEEAPDGPVLRLEGVLAQRPRTAFGRFFAYRLLRRPELLGCIRYVAKARKPELGETPWPFLA